MSLAGRRPASAARAGPTRSSGTTSQLLAALNANVSPANGAASRGAGTVKREQYIQPPPHSLTAHAATSRPNSARTVSRGPTASPAAYTTPQRSRVQAAPYGVPEAPAAATLERRRLVADFLREPIKVPTRPPEVRPELSVGGGRARRASGVVAAVPEDTPSAPLRCVAPAPSVALPAAPVPVSSSASTSRSPGPPTDAVARAVPAAPTMGGAAKAAEGPAAPTPQPPAAVLPPATNVPCPDGMERRHSGEWVSKYPPTGHFACSACHTPLLKATSKIPSIGGYATFRTYFSHAVALAIVVPVAGGTFEDSFVALRCVQCASFIGRVADGGDDAVQVNSAAIAHSAKAAPPGYREEGDPDDDGVGHRSVIAQRRRRGPADAVPLASDGTSSDSDSDGGSDADADDTLWRALRSRQQT